MVHISSPVSNVAFTLPDIKKSLFFAAGEQGACDDDMFAVASSSAPARKGKAVVPSGCDFSHQIPESL